ncbi:hypothetical protein VTN96DRAFT_419 [Rasamsonia emersonii]
MAGLSPSAIIVIALAVSALAVTILVAFSHYLGKQDENPMTRPRSREQELYMRQVRQRTHEFAYAESVSGISPSGKGMGAESSRSSAVGGGRGSQLYSSNNNSSATGNWGRRSRQGPNNGYGHNGNGNYGYDDYSGGGNYDYNYSEHYDYNYDEGDAYAGNHGDGHGNANRYAGGSVRQNQEKLATSTT